jgi:hypothetical protein
MASGRFFKFHDILNVSISVELTAKSETANPSIMLWLDYELMFYRQKGRTAKNRAFHTKP